MSDVTYHTTAAPAPFGRRVLQTFFAPADLFRASGGYAPWAGPLLVSILVGMLVVLAVPSEAFMAMTEGAVNRRGRPVEITSDTETVAYYGRMLGMLTVLARQPLAAFLFAGVLTLIFGVLLRGEGRYQQYLTITVHAFLITALGSLVAVAVAVLRGSEPKGISLALLPVFPPDSFASRFLEGIDVFTLWALLFAAVGVSVVNRHRSRAGAAAILLGLYVAAAAGVAALSA